jgi:Peptidase MA superfamily
MRLLAFALAALLLAPQDAPTSRASLASDWCRVEFRPELRPRALEFLRAAAPARARVQDRLGLDVGGRVTVVVVRDRDEMRNEVVARIGREPPDWAGGLALPQLDLVLVRADQPGEEFDRVDAILTHELVHIAVARANQSAVRAIPRWFEEGLAQWVAGRARPLDVPDLRPAATFGWLLDLDEMNAAFSQGEGAAARAYAQAESFVRFVARRGGSGKIKNTVELLLAGVEPEAALTVATGSGLVASWASWRAELASDRSWMLATATQMIVALLLLAAVVLGVRKVLRRKRAIEDRWAKEPPEEEEAEGAL